MLENNILAMNKEWFIFKLIRKIANLTLVGKVKCISEQDKI